MIRVAIETSTPVGTVAVGRAGHLLAEVELGAQRRHAEMTLPALEEALREAGVERTAIEEVVVGAGPGSFTGVRVAGATAKGLVTALGVPLRSFSSLLAVAAEAGTEEPVCALLDARRGEVYAACWRVGAGALQEILPPMVGPVEDAIRQTAEASPLFAGEGAERYRDVLERLGGRLTQAPVHPRAATLLRLAALDPDAGRVAEPSSWEPLYVRASSAERGVAG